MEILRVKYCMYYNLNLYKFNLCIGAYNVFCILITTIYTCVCVCVCVCEMRNLIKRFKLRN